ncbi:MAG: MvdC/MvdD family ATP grasp protein [Pseudonocardiaceae bacterium]
MSGSVWVVTRRLDATADVVIDELNRRGVPVVRFDLGEITVSAELVGSRWVGQLSTKTRTARIEDTAGIYYRRPSPPTAPTGTDAEISAWVEAEARWGLRGLLAALPRHRWINWPPAVHAAEHKPYQLTTAAACGLPVPRTAIVNDPDAAARFSVDAGPVLYKAFRGKPVRIADQTHLTYATPVTPTQCHSESVRVAPTMLQTRIDKAFDARVTCVDRRLFAIAPRGPGGAVPLDWRVDHTALTWEPVDIPDQVGARLQDFLARLDLRFAACDLCVDHSGVWWLIEANPAGQWAWDHPLRDAIASAIADALTQETTSS